MKIQSLIILVVGLMFLVLLSFLCIGYHGPLIEQDLTTRVNSAHAAEGINWSSTEADGRNITLTGIAPSEESKRKAGEIAANIRGVAQVENQLTVSRTADTTNGASEPTLPEPAQTEKAPIESSTTPETQSALQTEPASGTLSSATTDATTESQIAETPTDSLSAKMDEDKADKNSLADSAEDIASKSETAGVDEAVTPSIKDCKQKLSSIIKQQTILFGSKSTTLNEDYHPMLDEVATLLLNCPGLHLEIGGHTDTVGLRPKNLKLSQTRADSVAQYLISKGLDSTQLTATGYGEMRPIADNATAEGKAQNRRIEFNVQETR